MTRAGKINLVVGLLIGVLPAPGAFGQEQPAAVVDCYKAVLADGKEIAGAVLDGWKDLQRPPTLTGVNIFDPNNPVRMLWDVRRKPNLNGPFIEFTNGDVLACQIKQYLPADPGSGLPARLNVELAPPLITYRNAQQILVRADRVRRIVQTDSPVEDYQVGTIIYKNGTRKQVNSLKMTADGIQALDADSVITAQYEDLAEVHLSCESPEEGSTRDLTGLCPSPQSLVVRFATADGGIMTFRHAMMSRGEYYGFPNLRGNVPFMAIQPAWALSAVKVPVESICIISCRQANEMLASLLNIRTVSEKSYTGMLMRWRRNCNVRGQMLESGNIVTNLGIGVHSFSQVAIEMPKSARSFSCLAGLDRSAGSGGCVEARIYKDQASGEPIWKSGYIRGGDKLIRVGPIDVEGAKQIILECDYGHNGRPAGAEPFDIRDEFDWILPVVTVDPAKLPKPDLQQLLPQIAGWKVEKLPEKLDFAAAWNEQGGFWDTTMTMPAGQPLTLSRQITASKKLGVFELRLARPAAAKNWDHSVVLKVNDKPVAEITNLFRPDYPRNQHTEGTMGFVPLDPYFGVKTDLNLTIQRVPSAGNDNSGITICRLALTALGDDEKDETGDQSTVVPLNSLIRTYSKNGSGDIRKDRNYNNSLIRIHGVAYSTGLGVYPLSVAKFDLGMKYKTFISDIGIDDMTGGNYSAVFEVWADDVKLYESGNVRGGMAAKRVSVDVAGKQELKLVVKGGDTGNNGSYACWAGPRLIKDPDAAKRIASNSGKTPDKVVKAGYYMGIGGVNFGPKDDSSLFENLQPEMAERL
ncbi:MAG: NPCBM/NEW2 domain-containing protein [Planctomycetes bacterium]|nr:NPCBM/NEW2 domain-containing protein [Planctomycetota bacterium]